MKIKRGCGLKVVEGLLGGHISGYERGGGAGRRGRCDMLEPHGCLME